MVFASLKRRIIAAAMVLISLVSAVPLRVYAQPPTPGPTQPFDYWDAALHLEYPVDWGAPDIIAGQAFFSPVTGTNENAIKHPFFAVRLVDPQREFNLAKDAPLEALAQTVALASGFTDVEILESASAAVANVEAWVIRLAAQVKLNDAELIEVIGQSVALLLPDGRYVTLIATSPRDDWPTYVGVASQILQSITFLRSSKYVAPTVGAQVGTFGPGAVTFNIPDGWVDRVETGVTARVFQQPDALTYADGSGLVNGPQLVTLAIPLNANETPRQALNRFLGFPSATPLKETTIGDAVAAAETISVTDISAHALTFVAFASQDNRTLNIFRWSSPGALIDATRQTFDAILASIKLDPFPSVYAPPDFATLAGLPVSATDDGTFVVGDPEAPIRVIQFTDYACPYCAAYAPITHQFMLGYVKEGKAKLELRYLTNTGGELSLLGGLTALCAGDQGKQVEMHDLLFYVAQTQGVKGGFTLDNLMTQSGLISGMDPTKLRSCITSGKYVPVMEAARALAERYQIAATPTILILNESAPTAIQQFRPTDDLAALNAAVDKLLP